MVQIPDIFDGGRGGMLSYEVTLLFFMIERFSLDCRKTKTKVNTLANQRA